MSCQDTAGLRGDAGRGGSLANTWRHFSPRQRLGWQSGSPYINLPDFSVPFNPTEDIEKEQPTLLRICAVTRAQVCAAEAVDSESPFIPQTIAGEDPVTPRPDVSILSQLISEQNLEEAQKQDPTLKRLHLIAFRRKHRTRLPTSTRI